MSFEVKKSDSNITVMDKDKIVSYEITDKEITKLRPISIIDNTLWILVYLATKQTVVDKKGKITTTFNNFPYFVTSKKELFNAKNDKLAQTFQTPDFVIGVKPRWDKKDLDHYLTSGVKVEIKNSFEQIREQFSKLFELKSEDYLNVLVIWTVGTYLYKIFEHYPYIDLIASKGSGKSKVLYSLECTCYNAHLTSHLTGSAWSRMVESLACTLLIDETEGLGEPQFEHEKNLSTMLRSSFKTDAQTIINVPTIGSSWTPKIFDIGVPVALAHINPLHEVTADRTIPLPILKSTNQEMLDAEVNKGDMIWKLIRNSLYRIALDYFEEVKEIKKERIDMPHISSRDRNQIWRPIITIARLFEKYGVQDLLESILRVVEETHQSRTTTNQSSNADVQIIELLCESLDDRILPISNNESSKHWYSQKSILDIAKTIGLEYISAKELGNILARLAFAKKKRNPYGMCVFVTDEILKNLCQKYNLDFEALTADKSHQDQSEAQSA